jgi:hypothetical protein
MADDSRRDGLNTTQSARYSWSEKGIAYVCLVLFLVLLCGGFGVFGQPREPFVIIVGAGFVALSAAMAWNCSESVIADSHGIAWHKWLCGRHELLWSDIDEVQDRETRLYVGCSWRGTRIGLSRRLHGFESVLNALKNQSNVQDLLVNQPHAPLPANFSVGWNALSGVLVIGPLGICLGILAALGEEPVLAAVSVAAIGLCVWGAPFLRCRIHENRVELRGVLRTYVVPFSNLASIEFDSEEFHTHGIKVGQLTNHKLVFCMTEGERLEFAPRTGALAMWYCATAALESWRAAIGTVNG